MASQEDVVRPGIIIGLGGTGQWVLTFLKKELLEVGGGKMPSTVKLIAFDTTSQTTAEAGKAGIRQDEEDVRAGAVQLIEDKEFIPIGDNVMQLAQGIASGQHTHLQWFPAKTLLGKLPPAAFNTKEGSGQIRQMGRISVFRDLSALKHSKVLSSISSAIQDLQKVVSKDRQLEVIIVGSLAGGTGAGMLVDMALLLRAQAERLVQKNYIVRGFFVLPRAFTSAGIGESRDMLARSFAAWRELDRFMIVSEQFGIRQINYHAQNADLRLKIDRRAYDVSYLVDPARQTVNSLDNMMPEDGLYPALAHCLSAILDNKAGKEYTEFVTTNLAGKLAQLPLKPYHSAIGSYTLKVPVYYAGEKFSHQLALEALEQFLRPEVNPKGRVTRVSEMHNREVPQGHVGLQAVLAFMQSPALNIAGEEIPNTKLPQLIADMRARDAQRDDNIKNQVARGGLTRANSRWLHALTDISQDQTGQAIIRDISDELNFPIWKDVATSRVVGDLPQHALTRFRNQVPKVRHEHYGLDTAGGERLRGTYGTALEKAKNAQLARFRMLLRAWTEHALNGESTDPLLSRTGKLGYAVSFYEALIETFAYFIVFLNQVRQKRNEELRLAARTQEAAKSAWARFEREAGKKCWLTFWDGFVHPDAHRVQRNYLQAEQRDIDVRKDDILLDVLAEVASNMQAIAERGRDELNRWVGLLATGQPEKKLEGLYHTARRSLSNVNVNHELDKRLDKVSGIIGEHEYQSRPEYVAELLGQLKWQISMEEGRLQLACGVESPSENPDAHPDFIPFKRSGEKPDQHNLEILLRFSERRYQTLHQERPLAREIQAKYETGEKLTLAVNGMGEPLFTPSPTPQGPQVVACYIRVHSDLDEDTTRYFAKFKQEMEDRNSYIKPNLKLVDSQDKHKLTIVRSDDLLPSSDFSMWHACRRAYIEQVTDPYRGIPAGELHIFPAEINACLYEAEMPAALGKQYRTLHPEVVALLEDRERFEMFFLASALGFVRLDESGGQPVWIFQLPDEEEIYLTTPAETLEVGRQEDIFQVLNNFAIDGRDQRPGLGGARWIDWSKLRSAILGKQKELGKAKLTKIYERQIDHAQGMVLRIMADVQLRRSLVEDEALRQTIGQEHEDLADLATVVFRKWIKQADSLSDNNK
jgi:hypothetical protein